MELVLQGLVEIVGQKIVLSPFRADFVEAYCRWLADPYIQKMAGETAASQEQVIARHKAWREAGEFIEYIVLDRVTSVPIGDVSLDFSHRPPHLGIMIGEPRFRGSGRAAEAIQLIEQLAHAHGSRSIVAEIYDCNPHSLDFHRKLGFSCIRHDTEHSQWICEKVLTLAAGS